MVQNKKGNTIKVVEYIFLGKQIKRGIFIFEVK